MKAKLSQVADVLAGLIGLVAEAILIAVVIVVAVCVVGKKVYQEVKYVYSR